MKEGVVLNQEYITALDQEKQAICDQLNRRTEFIVLRTTYGMFDSEGKPTNLPQPKSKPQSEDNADEGFEIEE
jgi:hypothetical protein